MPTKIEWAEETWNPVTGCTPISEGCRNCYAERMARRLAGRFDYPEAPRHFDVTVHEDKMDQPLRWKKPRRIFVVSMGDLFHKDVLEDVLGYLWWIMRQVRRHTYLVLTKRPERMREFIAYGLEMGTNDFRTLYPHVLLGVTAENQKRADERIPILLQIPAAGHFVCLEPMLSAIDLSLWLPLPLRGDLTYGEYDTPVPTDLALSWVICGGESGPGARPMHPAWPRSVRDQCQESGTPFLFKQWGAWWPTGQSRTSSIIRTIPLRSPGWVDIRGGFKELHYSAAMRDAVQVWRVGKKAAGRLLDGRTWDEYPEPGQ